MPFKIEAPISFTARERHWQISALLRENGVPEPFVLWLDGRALPAFLASIGKENDGRIRAFDLYKYNFKSGRYKKAEPYDPNRGTK